MDTPAKASAAATLAFALLLVVFRPEVSGSAALSSTFFVGIPTMALITSVLVMRQWGVPRRNSLLLLAIGMGFIVLRLPIAFTPISTSSCLSGTTFSCIMDERYYVPAAQYLLSGAKCPLVGNNTIESPCNLEHPPLVKLMMAGSTLLLGNGPLGLRFPAFLFGTLLIPLVFALARAAGGDYNVSVIASFLTATDMLVLLHSSAALLDIPAMVFGLAAIAYFMLRWKDNAAPRRRYADLAVTGLLFGLGMLCKETTVIYLMFMVAYYMLSAGFRGKARLASIAWNSAILLAFSIAVFVAGLWAFDYFFVPAFSGPLSAVLYMVGFGSVQVGGGWFNTAFATAITPFNWISFFVPHEYYIGTHFGFLPFERVYFGAPDMIIVWLAFVWLSYLLIDINGGAGQERRRSIRHRLRILFAAMLLSALAAAASAVAYAHTSSANATAGLMERFAFAIFFLMPFALLAFIVVELLLSSDKKGQRAALRRNATGVFAFLMFATVYFAFFALYAFIGRRTYPYYMLQFMPALAVGAGYFLMRKKNLLLPVLALSTAWFVYFYIVAL